ncbi:MAG TPA: nicotinate phosphoribosyltransferase, partial [Lacipirellulaceae bacterium]|nr:nicotinate phosphoribosyltransferase [Lacipirellulaceae bacterium]
GGVPAAEAESLDVIRQRAQTQLSRLDSRVRRFMNPHEFPVGLDMGLQELRDEMIRRARHRRIAGAAN